MKIYTHDYSLPSAAESLLYKAQKAFAEDAPETALEHICQARELLQTYLAGDNIRSDADAYGFVKQGETFDDMQLQIIREVFAKMLDEDTASPHAWDYFNIIDICQLQTGCPEFGSIQNYIARDRESHWGDCVKKD